MYICVLYHYRLFLCYTSKRFYNYLYVLSKFRFINRSTFTYRSITGVLNYIHVTQMNIHHTIRPV